VGYDHVETPANPEASETRSKNVDVCIDATISSTGWDSGAAVEGKFFYRAAAAIRGGD
jgi:hypothetical protein